MIREPDKKILAGAWRKELASLKKSYEGRKQEVAELNRLYESNRAEGKPVNTIMMEDTI